MKQTAQFQPANRIGDFYSTKTNSNQEPRTAKTKSHGIDIENLTLEDLTKIAISLESIIRLGKGVGSSIGAFSSPLYMLAAGSLMTNWLSPIIGSDGASLDGSIERGLQKPPQFNTPKTLTEQLAEADAHVVSAKASRKAVRTSVTEQAKSVLKSTGHTVRKGKTNSTDSKKGSNKKLSKEERSQRDLEFTSSIRDAKGNIAASMARVKTAKAGNTTEKELALSQKQLTRDQVQLAALGHARDNGISVGEAKVATSTILSKMDGIDTALSESHIENTSRNGNWFTGFFKARTTETDSRDIIPSAYSTIAMNYEDIENTLNQFGSPALRNAIEANPHYSTARDIHTKASQF